MLETQHLIAAYNDIFIAHSPSFIVIFNENFKVLNLAWN